MDLFCVGGSDFDMSHQFADPFGNFLPHKIIAGSDAYRGVAVAFERAPDRTGIAVAYAQVDNDLAGWEGFGGHVEVQQMSVCVLYGAAYARCAVVAAGACNRELATFGVGREEAFFRMEEKISVSSGVIFFK